MTTAETARQQLRAALDREDRALAEYKARQRETDAAWAALRAAVEEEKQCTN
jgi:hypothetical protein